MMAPISDNAAMDLRWPPCSGVSRTINTSLRRSLRVTSADRVSNVEVTPVAISDIERIDHAGGAERSGRNRGRHIADVMNGMRGRLDIRYLQRRLVGEGEFGGL